VVLCNSHDLEREQQHIDLLVSRGVDGIIVAARREDVRPPIDVGRTPVPVVYAFTQVTDANALCILPDEIQVTRLAIEHLIQSGRHHFAHITGPSYFEAVRVREQSMRQVLAEHDLHLSEHQALSGPWQENWGYTAARYLFDQNHTIDALFCGSDHLTRGACDAFLNLWNEFLAALIFMTDSSKFTLPILLLNATSGQFGSVDLGAVQAGVVVTMVPCLILFLLLQRYYVNGLAAGAIKA
jgi:ABC-type sugar transport system substrate-binding protein